MRKLLLLTFVLLCGTSLFAQNEFLIFRKNNKTTSRYFKGSHIAFQANDRNWRSGNLTKITADSFYITPSYVVYHVITTDTVIMDVQGFALSDVAALPRPGVQIDFINGRFQITRSGGNVKWYWIKSGWVFRVGGAGYGGLHLANEVLNNTLSIKDSKNYLIGAGSAFLFGMALKKLYKPVVKVGGRNKLSAIVF